MQSITANQYCLNHTVFQLAKKNVFVGFICMFHIRFSVKLHISNKNSCDIIYTYRSIEVLKYPADAISTKILNL